MGVAQPEHSEDNEETDSTTDAKGRNDALMILGVDREIDTNLAKALAEVEGVVEVRVVNL